ncbi:MAG: hypothetical protein H6713_03325 [Myxococcales bacterium]|nr:hypothetical protein [Myxococcales bacterium]
MSFSSVEQRDFLLVMIEKLGETLRALVGGQQTHALEDDALDEAGDELDAALEREFGAVHAHLERLDAPSVTGMVRPLGRLRAYASVLGYRAAIALRRGEPGWIARGARALELLRLVQQEERALPRPPARSVDAALIETLAALLNTREGDAT